MSIHQPLHLDDLALAARIAAGDEDALHWFTQECARRSEVLARYAHIPRQDREDIVQDALSAAFEAMQRKLYRGEGKLTSWLEQIIRGIIARYWRKNPPATTESLDELDERGLESAVAESHLAQVKRNQTREIQKLETKVMVEETLRRMSPHQRAFLVLNRIEGYTPKALGEMGNISVNQVRNQIYTAQDKFRVLYLEKTPPAETTSPKALLPPDTADEGVTYAQSENHSSRASLRRAGDQPKDYSLLLRTSRRIGQAFKRIGQGFAGRASARMRSLLAGGAAIGSGYRRVGFGS